MLSNFSFVLEDELAGCAHPETFGDCDEALRELRECRIGAIVSLDEDGLPLYLIADYGFQYLHLPVADFEAPSLKQVEEFVEFVARCKSEGCPVVAHCRAGFGRTGTMLACYMVACGKSAREAIREIRELRPGSIETPNQEELVRNYERSLRDTR